MPAGTCRACGCTDNDCRQCIAKTGAPCCWIEPDLCSACYPTVELRRELDEQVAAGVLSQADSDEAFALFDRLSDQEMSGQLTAEDALNQVMALGLNQVRRRAQRRAGN